MKIFEFTDYKVFLQELIQSMPRRGHGIARRLAEHLRVNSVVISQVLSGDRHFTPEQALPIAAFFGFDEPTTEYLLNLISKERAGTKDLADYHERKLKKLRADYLKLKSRIVAATEISDEDKGVFYSNWYYSAVRQLCSIEGFQTVDAIASHLKLSPSTTAEVVRFLVERGLCVEENGKVLRGPATTFIDASSKYINNHRRNWRLKSMERLVEPGPHDYFFSGLYSLSEEDFEVIRKNLADLIGSNSKRVKDSPSEQLAVINIDWFKL